MLSAVADDCIEGSPYASGTAAKTKFASLNVCS